MAGAVEEPTAEELDELAQLAAALTGDPDQAAELIGATLARSGRRTRRRPGDSETARRNLMVQRFVAARPAGGPPPSSEGLPAEFRAVAIRLFELRPLARAILVLVRLKGLTLSEVAGLLDRSPSAVQKELEAAATGLQAESHVVHATLESLSWRTPEEDAIRRARVQAERRQTRQGRRIRLVVAALVVLILASVAVPTLRAMRPLPARTAGEWSYGLVLTPPDSWTVAAHFLTVDEEVLELNGLDTHCTVQALLPSASPENRADRPPTSERVWIRGRPVRFNALGQEFRAQWPYAGTGTVTITCEGSGADRASTLDLANRLQFRPGQRLPVPVALGPLPDGLRAAYAGTQQNQTFVGLITGAGLESAEIFVFAGLFDQEEFSGAAWTAREVVEVNGAAAQVYVADALVALCLPVSAPDQVCVGSDINDQVVEPNDIEKRARLEINHRRVRAVAEGMKIAPDLNDRSTWFDAREAFPR